MPSLGKCAFVLALLSVVAMLECDGRVTPQTRRLLAARGLPSTCDPGAACHMFSGALMGLPLDRQYGNGSCQQW
jgi:hypothetical protein